LNPTKRAPIDEILNELHKKGQAWGGSGAPTSHGIIATATAEGVTSEGQTKDVADAMKRIQEILDAEQ
jgi:hypothetical protein